MKRALAVGFVAMIGCTDSETQLTWELALEYQSTSCGMRETVKFWLMDRDGILYASTNLPDRAIAVENTADDDVAITIADGDIDARFYVHLTRSVNETAILDGTGSVDRAGSNSCRDVFTLTGDSFPEATSCGQDEATCATVYAWQW